MEITFVRSLLDPEQAGVRVKYPPERLAHMKEFVTACRDGKQYYYCIALTTFATFPY